MSLIQITLLLKSLRIYTQRRFTKKKEIMIDRYFVFSLFIYTIEIIFR